MRAKEDAKKEQQKKLVGMNYLEPKKLSELDKNHPERKKLEGMLKWLHNN